MGILVWEVRNSGTSGSDFGKVVQAGFSGDFDFEAFREAVSAELRVQVLNPG
jgi:hypothetical protein